MEPLFTKIHVLDVDFYHSWGSISKLESTCTKIYTQKTELSFMKIHEQDGATVPKDR